MENGLSLVLVLMLLDGRDLYSVDSKREGNKYNECITVNKSRDFSMDKHNIDKT